MSAGDRTATPAGLPAVAATGTAVATVPAQLREIADVAGARAALLIMQHNGGTEIWIPHYAEVGHWLADTVGAELAERICAHYRTTNADGRTVGSVRLYVPLGDASVLAAARRQVIADVEAGSTVRDAARRAGLSERTAHRALGKSRDGRQGDLFAARD